jgi:hypothetical protein
MQQGLFEFSVYTIAHPDKLAAAASRSRATKFSEAKAWKTGYDLWNKAKAAGAAMPVVFADATDCSRPLYWEARDEECKYDVRGMSGHRTFSSRYRTARCRQRVFPEFRTLQTYIRVMRDREQPFRGGKGGQFFPGIPNGCNAGTPGESCWTFVFSNSAFSLPASASRPAWR